MRVQLLLADETEHPLGGMGEHARRIVEAAPPDVRYDVLGCGAQAAGLRDGHRYLPLRPDPPDVGQLDLRAMALLAQTDFALASVVAGQTHRPDLIHAYDWSTAYAGVAAARFWDVPLVFSLHLSVTDGEPGSEAEAAWRRVAGALEHHGLARGVAVLQVSAAYARKLSSAWWPKTVVVPNGIDLATWTPRDDATRLRLPGTRPFKLLFVGRFAPQKGLDALLAAELPPTVDLCLLGSAKGGSRALEAAVVQAVEERDGVHWLGARYGQDKVDFLHDADAVVMPSRFEPFGIVALEALASGALLLSSGVDGLGEVAGPDVALPCGTNPDTITAALARAVAMDDTERTLRRALGFSVCARHTWAAASARITAVYRSLVAPVPQDVPADCLSDS